ncbi:LysM peptidoglycan-binding domain-containing protein [Paenibacillus sp. FSL K6-1566]|uniref:LysM peptidoglycan-binding domain-containing protein n=1 Tax=Paenibacillus sp. FSL K6-1566 TaxID=2954515 RepID=UPI00048EF6AC
MFDQSYGLRFDIYERINLAEELPGIEELEEAELIPHIQVISQQDQATLRGHLLLAGVYKGDTETGESEPLEHWIPVEITVPMNRVSSLDDIAVEIENFDIDLLSRRSLNITGVLSLRGIQAAAPGVRDQAWANEEFTVVHAPEPSGTQTAGEPAAEAGYEPFQANEEPSGSNDAAASHPSETAPFVNFRASIQEQEERTQQYLASWAQYENQIRREEEPVSDTRMAAAADDADARDTVEYALHNDPEPAAQEAEPSVPSVWQFERKAEPEPAPEAQAEEVASAFPGVVDRKGDGVEAVPDLQAVDAGVQETYEAPEPADSAAEEAEVVLKAEEPSDPGKPELKVAFSTKGSDAAASSGVGFSSLLHSSRLVQDQEIAALDEEEKAEELAEPASTEDVEWKSLFLGNRREETPFRKVRMCIVQREETLDIIAERYQLSPRELLLYNRMSEQNVEEGQVLYIPQ